MGTESIIIIYSRKNYINILPIYTIPIIIKLKRALYNRKKGTLESAIFSMLGIEV